MNNRPSNSALRLANWLILTTGVVVFAGFMIHKNKVGKLTSGDSEVEATLEKEFATDDFDSISNRLMVESIVAIVQNYYVDEQRIRGEYLVQGALKLLFQRYPEMEMIGNTKDVVVSAKGKEITSFAINPLEYEDLVESLIDLSTYIDRTYHADYDRDGSDVQLSPGYQAVLDSLLSGLDAHSTFLDTDEYAELRQGTEGQFGGLGILVGIRDNLLTVIKPLPNSPALRVGLRKLDKIIRINGVETYGFTLDELVDHMRGEPGSKVSISVLREGLAAPLNLELARQKINVNSVSHKMIENGEYKTGYVAIESFSSRTSFEVAEALAKIKESAGSTFNGLILDLRSNPGGLLDQAVQVTDLFIDSGVIVSTRGRRQEVEFAEDLESDLDYPIMILINGDTASASEIVSGALQDHNRALVVGQPTFGKGTVQTIFELPGGQALKLTVARYYTPSDRSIQTVGIVPDIWLQPIYRAAENSDLMGGFHYRSERFLSNHISLQAGYIDDNLHMNYPSFLKGYYLTDRVDYPEMNPRSVGEDKELDLALNVIKAVSDTYGPKLPPGARRAQHWLGVAADSTTSTINQYQAESEAWLKEKYGIDWKSGKPDLENQVELIAGWESIETFSGGQTVEVPFKIRNLSDEHLERLSVFLWTHEGVLYNEKLVGLVKRGEVRSGSIAVAVPYGVNISKVNLNMALSIDANPISSSNQSKLFHLDKTELPKFKVSHVYLDNGQKVNGVVDPGEYGKMKIIIKNQDSRDYQNLQVNVVSLNGQQLTFTSQRDSKIKLLQKGKTKEVGVSVQANSSLSADRLYLGLEVRSGEGAMIYTKGFSIESTPNVTPPRSAVLMGH